MPTEITIADLKGAEDLDLGVGEWLTVDQAQINLFADATHDHQWIHLDEERAQDGPFGTTIAHGYLTLSLMPKLLEGLLRVTDATMGVNYGINRLRLTAPVPAGSRVRLKAKILGANERGGAVMYRVAGEVEVEGTNRPALVGEFVYLVYGRS